MNNKWRVTKTKSGKRWVAWRIRQKARTGMVFVTWKEAITYALLTAYVDQCMKKVY